MNPELERAKERYHSVEPPEELAFAVATAVRGGRPGPPEQARPAPEPRYSPGQLRLLCPSGQYQPHLCPGGI